MRTGIAVLAVAGVFVAYAALPMLWADGPTPRDPWQGPALQEISHTEFRVNNDDVSLAALVFVPEAPKAIAMVIHGSGPSRRDHGWYMRLAQHLNDHGVGLILPDKRGSESSEGDWQTAGIQVLASDASVILDEVRSLWPDLPIGVLGASQGGWVAPVLAKERPDLDFVIAQSASGVPAISQLTFEETNTLAQAGMPRPAARLVAPISAWSVRAIRQKPFWDAVGDFDVIDHWADVHQRSLVVYGALDETDNVPVSRSVARLAALGRSNIQVKVLDGLGHSMNAPGSGVVSVEFLQLVTEFALDASE